MIEIFCSFFYNNIQIHPAQISHKKSIICTLVVKALVFNRPKKKKKMSEFYLTGWRLRESGEISADSASPLRLERIRQGIR